MKRTALVLICLLACFHLAFGQSATFRAEELTMRPDSIDVTKCVQVGIFLDYTGPTTSWWAIQVVLDYSYPTGLADNTALGVLSSFTAGQNMGLTNPGSSLSNSGGTSTSCNSSNILNSVVLSGGADMLLMEDNGPAAIVNESVTPVIDGGEVSLLALNLSTLFTLEDGNSYLVAVVEFEVPSSNINGVLDLTFRTGASDNFIQDGAGTTINPSLDNGFVNLFQEEDCGATNNMSLTDTVGGNSASTTTSSSMSAGWLDPTWGGTGANVDIDVNYGSRVSAYRLLGDDGFDSGMVSVTGPGTAMHSVQPTNSATVYTTTYYTEDINSNPVAGAPCSITVNIAAPSCTLTWDNGGGAIPGVGETGILQATLTNALPDGGSVFGTLNVPDGATGLVDPMLINGATTVLGTSGATVTLELINQVVPDTTWAGNYVIEGLTGVTDGVSGCSAGLGFVCPTNNTSAMDNPIALGSPITGDLAANDVVEYHIIYNGVTTVVPRGGTTFTTTNSVVAGDTDLTIAATGFGPDGLACDDSVVLNLDYISATCDTALQTPDATVNPAFPGQNILLSLETEGASEVTIDGVPMTAVSGTPGEDNAITWNFNYTAIEDAVVDVLVSNPEGQTTTCSWNIDVDCLPPRIIMATITQPLLISGSEGCVYTARATDLMTTVSTESDITIDSGGFGQGGDLFPDMLIEVGQLGLPAVLDSRHTVKSVLLGVLPMWPDPNTVLDLIPLLDP